jgi:hypothetical protein
MTKLGEREGGREREREGERELDEEGLAHFSQKTVAICNVSFGPNLPMITSAHLDHIGATGEVVWNISNFPTFPPQ